MEMPVELLCGSTRPALSEGPTGMSAPHPEGRVQPRRNVLRSVQARAAVESVLVPVCGRNLAFPVRREIPAEVRRL